MTREDRLGRKCENGTDVSISESRMSKPRTVKTGARMNGRILE